MPKGTPIPLPIPIRGFRQDVPSHDVPLDATPNCENVYIDTNGELVVRAGFDDLYTSGNEPSDRIMGGIQYRAADTAYRTVVGTLTELWYDTGSQWGNITGSTTLTGDANDHVRFATFASGGNIQLVAVNDTNAPQVWNGDVTTVFADLSGSPPIGRDVTVAANRVILGNVVESGTRAPSRIRISDINDHTTWDAANFSDLAATDDIIVAVRQISRTSFAIHKSHSQWIGAAQEGDFPFRLEVVDTKPGPVSPSAVVNIGGVHYWVGEDASVYRFDGLVATEIGQPVIRTLEANLNWQNRQRTHGYYNSGLHQIWWYYPSTDGNTLIRSLVYDLRRGIWWPQATASAARITASFGYKIDAQSAVSQFAILGNQDGTTFQFGGSGKTNDDGTAIAAYWESPPKAYSGLDAETYVLGAETFFKKVAANANVTVSLGATNTLGAEVSYSVTGTVDASVDQRHEVKTTDTSEVIGRFAGVKHNVSVTTVATTWRGGVLYTERKPLD